MKTALVTGASSGMGLEFARGLGARGYDLLLVSNREDDLAAAASELGAGLPVKVGTRFQDLATPDAADVLFEWCTGQGIVPDVTGMGARDAVYELERRGLKVALVGRGKVKSQSIAAGKAVTPGTLCELRLEI